MLFTILGFVYRFDTKLWLPLNSLLVCFVQLKKNVQISKFDLGIQAQLYMKNG